MFKACPAFRAALPTVSLAIPVCACEVPLAENSIREAYFPGTRKGDSSDLTVPFDTSDGRHGETRFDLQALR